MTFLKKFQRNYFLIVIIAVFVFFSLRLILQSSPTMLQLDTPTEFQDGWNIATDQPSNTIVLSREISEGMLGKVVCFYVYDAFVDADVNGEAIYQYGTSSRFLQSPASLYHMITVPATALGDILSIRIQFVYDYKYTTDIDIMLGSSGSIILSLLADESLDLVINTVLLVLGIILCALYLLELKNNLRNERSLFLGLLSLCFVAWTSNSMFLVQLVLPYGAVQYFTYYFFMFLLPLLLICYLETITKHLRFNILFWSHIGLGLVLTVLQLTGVSEFTETLGIFLIYSAVELRFVVIRLLANRDSHKSRLLIAAFIALILCILINAAMFFLNPTKGASTTLSKLGITFYLLVSIYESLGVIITDLMEAKNSKMLRKIAFTDSLTGIGNRYAFNDEINGLRLEDLSLFSIDINNLKYYNDTFGHACGDKLICEAAAMLGSVFKHLYRTGGDEFIAVEINSSPSDLADLKRKLNGLMRAYNTPDRKIVVEIACGYSTYQRDDHSYEDMLRRADAAMYEDKAVIKKTSRIVSVR